MGCVTMASLRLSAASESLFNGAHNFSGDLSLPDLNFAPEPFTLEPSNLEP